MVSSGLVGGFRPPWGRGRHYWQTAGDLDSFVVDHVSSTTRLKNNFESIQAGHDEGQATIMRLILDEGVPGADHRQHLLALSEFWANALDIGIGFADHPGSRYRYYWVVVIAKHDF